MARPGERPAGKERIRSRPAHACPTGAPQVFAFSLNSDHWSNIVPRLLLQGLLPNAVYEISEPMPNNVAQAQGNLRIVETEARYQLGRPAVCLTGQTLMHAGLPVKFFTLDDRCVCARDCTCAF